MLQPKAVQAESAPTKPPSAKHIAALDGVRGLAVLIVFVFHYGGGTHSSFRPVQMFGYLNKGGWSGVVLFFVLSGFLITGILWDSYTDPHWWRKFFARRSLRIFPLYFLALILVVFAAIPGGTARSVLALIWIPALFLENFPYLSRFSESMPSPADTFHLWSIAVEEQFYLVWPFLLRLMKTRRQAKLLCLTVFLASLLFRLALWTFYADAELYSHFLLTQAGALAAGGWLAVSYRGPEWPRIVRVAPAVALIGLVGFLTSGLLSHNFESGGRYMTTFGLPFITLFFAALLTFAVQPGAVSALLSTRWLRWLGGISYGVYVFHMLLRRLVESITHALASGRNPTVVLLTQFLVAAVLSVLAAMLSYHLYEKQFLRLKKYFVPQPIKRNLV